MPLPVAHTLAGATIYKGLDADGTLKAWPRLLLAVFLANLADADLIPGILVGEPNRYHHVGFSHSAVAAVFAAIVVALIAGALGKRWPTVSARSSAVASTALMVGLLLVSHVVLDAFNNDTRPPAGVPMFWPLSGAYVQIYPWFVAVAKLGGEGSPWQFVLSVLTPHNVYAAAWEFITVAPLFVVVAWTRKRRRPADREPAPKSGKA